MPDYGHALQFGTFITPQSARPDEVVELAQLTEEAGLDLVTFQDHPYQSAFLDTWTLLAYVAATTERVHVVGNVLNLPLRNPAVLARAAASLDRLSGGRFELGIGGGAFWDAIEAMGGPRRSPRETLEALSEAIDIIRGIWDVSRPGDVRLDGDHYRLTGAKRGPEPAHEIQIWVGALKPRMLGLIGEKADGWLPSLAYLQDGDLQRGNATIDEAANAAGREPREIRRLLNISPEVATVEQLLPFVLEYGVSTFILASDDPQAITRWGDVADALRAQIGPRAQEVVRKPYVLEKRRDGIDYDTVPASLASEAIEPGDKGYARVRSTYMRHGSPGLVLRPQSTNEVVEALGFARGQDVPLAIRSGGHGISGRSTNDGGVVIDLAGLNEIGVIGVIGEHRVRVGPGARWGHVARALTPHGLVISSGDYGGVGVGGLATAGGIGYLARKEGLTVDHLVAVTLVLGDGTVVRTDADNKPELFWAVRGAGGNFGIATEFEFAARPLGDSVYSTMIYDAESTAELLNRWGEHLEAAPRELTSFLYLFAQGGAAPLARAVHLFASEDTDAAVVALTPFTKIAPLLDQRASLTSYSAFLPAHDEPHYGTPPEPLVSNGFAEHLTTEIGDLLANGLRQGVAPWIAIRAVGGAVNDIPAAETAYAHRHQNFNVSSVGADETSFRTHWDGLRPHLDGLYLSFETDDRPERLEDAFPADTLSRLRTLKEQYDPDNVFDQNFPIEQVAESYS
jgi:alkanesulfonate monooxygenase SsuD/methylene tetrahydromethanopterin reductase-like flavin-dependent oxidoreductase (luciferase family)/FAD/FMN-containing dehydrogenase